MLYEVVLRATCQGQEIINRWNYVRTGTPASVSGSFALAYAMGFIKAGTPPVYAAVTVFMELTAVQSSQVAYDEVLVREIWDPLDFYTLPFLGGETGQIAGLAAPTFNATGFRTNRVRQDISRGTKRFAGVPAGWIGQNGVLVGGGDELAELGERMSEVITYDDEGNTVSFAPCVVSKQKYFVDDDPNRIAYKYYDSWALQQQHVATGILWQAYDNVRSQTSRQVGKGS